VECKMGFLCWIVGLTNVGKSTLGPRVKAIHD
jgi:GTPase Era involved in 16S rRNA processing